jgi:hypothetical protein
MQGHTAKTKAAYQDSLALWKDAEPAPTLPSSSLPSPNTQAEMNRSARKLPNPRSRPLLDRLSSISTRSTSDFQAEPSPVHHASPLLTATKPVLAATHSVGGVLTGIFELLREVFAMYLLELHGKPAEGDSHRSNHPSGDPTYRDERGCVAPQAASRLPETWY